MVWATRSKIAHHDYGMIALLEKYPSNIGWLTGPPVNSRIHPVWLGRAALTAQNIPSGKYPLQIEYPFVYKKNRFNGRAKGLIDFVFCEQDREILQANELVCNKEIKR